MTTNTLQQVQAMLDERGVLDVKFLFSKDASSTLPSVVLADVADVLQKYLEGKCEVVQDFSQEVLPA